MKKLIILITLLFLPLTSFASGPFDGIYSISFNGVVENYATVLETNNQIVVVIVDPDPKNTWSPLSGVRTGNSVTLTQLQGVSPSDIKLNTTVTFNDSDVSKATINSCVDGATFNCKFPTGITVDLNKIF